MKNNLRDYLYLSVLALSVAANIFFLAYWIPDYNLKIFLGKPAPEEAPMEFGLSEFIDNFKETTPDNERNTFDWFGSKKRILTIRTK